MVRYRRAGRVIRSLAVLLALGALASCAMRRELVAPTAPYSTPAAPDWHATQIARSSHRILGYRTDDGVHHRFEGTVRLVGDSLEFDAIPGGADAARVIRPASEVVAVDMFAVSVPAVLITAALAVALAIVAVYWYGL
jgi:hypothetical protein